MEEPQPQQKKSSKTTTLVILMGALQRIIPDISEEQEKVLKEAKQKETILFLKSISEFYKKAPKESKAFLAKFMRHIAFTIETDEEARNGFIKVMQDIMVAYKDASIEEATQMQTEEEK